MKKLVKSKVRWQKRHDLHGKDKYSSKKHCLFELFLNEFYSKHVEIEQKEIQWLEVLDPYVRYKLLTLSI